MDAETRMFLLGAYQLCFLSKSQIWSRGICVGALIFQTKTIESGRLLYSNLWIGLNVRFQGNIWPPWLNIWRKSQVLSLSMTSRRDISLQV